MQETHTSKKRNWAAKFLAIAVVASMVASTLVLFAPEASARTGTGSFGYIYKDHLESDGPSYSWEELIGASGTTKLIGYTTDAAQGPFNLPFTFKFYDQEFTTWSNGGDNGYITFASAVNYQWTPSTLPAGALGNAVAGAWFDGRFCNNYHADAGVYYNTLGTEGSRKFVVQVEDQSHYYASCYGTAGRDSMTWQIILHEGSNEITIQYKDAKGGYNGDNEVFAAGIQGTPPSGLTGLQYVYRQSPVAVADETAVRFFPPPPPVHDLRLTSTAVPDPISLVDANEVSAEVTNAGVNCTPAGDCTPVPETDVNVTAKIFDIQESTTTYTFDSGDEGFTTGAVQGANQWTTALNDGKGNHNYGDAGSSDGSWSSGRKSNAFGGLFKDNAKLHYDGTNILVADMGSSSIKQVSHSDRSVTTLFTNAALKNVFDVTKDGSGNFYTLSRPSGYGYPYNSQLCKWDSGGTQVGTCVAGTTLRYATAVTHYDGDILVLISGSYYSTTYRKVKMYDTDLAYQTGKDLDWGQGYPYAYPADMDVDDSNGDLYIAYRDYSGQMRQYDRDSSGDYDKTSYNRIYTYARYHVSVDVQDDVVYTNALYSSTGYGGMKKYPTGSTSASAVITVWNGFGDGSMHYGSVAVTSDASIYISSHYMYGYSSLYNNYDKVLYYAPGQTYTATTVLGPKPASFSYVSTPAINTADSIGMSMSFKVSYMVYFRYEGAYMESSVDGGSTWKYVPASVFTTGGYYGTTYATYNNPLTISNAAWTYYNSVNHYYYSSRYANTAPWESMELSLDSFTGYNDVRFRWIVGFNEYDNTNQYDSFFRLDDVAITTKGADQMYANQSIIISSMAFKEVETVTFFDTPSTAFIPTDEGLSVGSSVAIMITLGNGQVDEDTSNNRVVAFRDVKFVIFADNFDDGDMATDKGAWTTGVVQKGASSWSVTSGDSNSGAYSMSSGKRNSGSRPSDGYVSSPTLDLSLPVEASLQMLISHYSYSTYDGYQVQISEDNGTSWSLFAPEKTSTIDGTAPYNNCAACKGAYYEGYGWKLTTYRGYNQPLVGQSAYTYWGTTNTRSNWAPDPQDWAKAEFDLTPYVGQDDIKVRIVAGWGTLSAAYTLYDSFFRFDDFAVTGLVYDHNIAVSAEELPDPIKVGETVPIQATLLNAGIKTQTDAHMSVKMGPLVVTDLDESDDLESYSSKADATAAGWTTGESCAKSSGCSDWGGLNGMYQDGFVFNTNQGEGDDSKSWGQDNGEFRMYGGEGTAWVSTGSMDFSDAPSDLVLNLKHMYEFDGAWSEAYNGGQVQVSKDGGSTWTAVAPNGGYPGTISNSQGSGFGNPLYAKSAFIHSAGTSAEYEVDKFDMSDYVGESDVRVRFITGMWNSNAEDDGLYWVIDSVAFAGTLLTTTVFEKNVDPVNLVSAAKVDNSWDFTFTVPGKYKVTVEGWIGTDIASSTDQYTSDNYISFERQTMFEVTGTTADEAPLSDKNNADNERFYEGGWHSVKDNGVFQWIQSSTSDSSSPVWWIGADGAGTSGNGDDTSLVSPVFDLSKATSAKLVFDHRFAFQGNEYSWGGNYYDGGRIEISTNGGTTWSAIEPSSGQLYGGLVYNSAYYGNPLRNERAFVMSSSGGSNLVETQVDLEDYTGDGFDNLRLKLRMGGAFLNYGSTWEVDNLGIWAAGFDLSQISTSTSLPYALELGETAVITTQYQNNGEGDLGPSGAVSAAYAYAYVNDMEGTTVWSDSKSLGNLAMAYYDGSDVAQEGAKSATLSIDFPGLTTPGLYTVGIKSSTDTSGTTLADLFSSNNAETHMLIVGRSADIGTPLLTGGDGEGWSAVTTQPADVGSGAMGVDWDNSDVAVGSTTITVDSSGYTPAAITIALGTAVFWDNTGSAAHAVTDKDGNFDHPLPAGTKFGPFYFPEVGTYTYFDSTVGGLREGTVTVIASESVDLQVRTNPVKIWTSDSYLVFWADSDLSTDGDISVYAQRKGKTFDDPDTVALTSANGFSIIDGSNHESLGNSISGNSGGWNPYYIYLNSNKLGYSTLDYDASTDNAYTFVFRARGVQGSADIGGVEVIRTLGTGITFVKTDNSQLTYDIFPSLSVDVGYFAKNIGTKDNTLEITPSLSPQGEKYDAAGFKVFPSVTVNGDEFTTMRSTDNGDGSWTYAIDLKPDDEASLTLRYEAPAYDQKKGEPAGNRKFDLKFDPTDVASNVTLREPVTATLFIKPSQFVISDMVFDKQSALEGSDVNISVTAWNEGNYASDVLVVFYIIDPTQGDAYATPEGVQRLTRIANTTVPLMAPKAVLENSGAWPSYTATATWENVYIPVSTTQDYEDVKLYAMINPAAEQVDVDAGIKAQDEYLNEKDDNDASGHINIVKDKSSTPSFAIGLIGMSVAALIAAIGTSLRREEE